MSKMAPTFKSLPILLTTLLSVVFCQLSEDKNPSEKLIRNIHNALEDNFNNRQNNDNLHHNYNNNNVQHNNNNNHDNNNNHHNTHLFNTLTNNFNNHVNNNNNHHNNNNNNFVSNRNNNQHNNNNNHHQVSNTNELINFNNNLNGSPFNNRYLSHKYSQLNNNYNYNNGAGNSGYNVINRVPSTNGFYAYNEISDDGHGRTIKNSIREKLYENDYIDNGRGLTQEDLTHNRSSGLFITPGFPSRFHTVIPHPSPNNLPHPIDVRPHVLPSFGIHPEIPRNHVRMIPAPPVISRVPRQRFFPGAPGHFPVPRPVSVPVSPPVPAPSPIPMPPPVPVPTPEIPLRPFPMPQRVPTRQQFPTRQFPIISRLATQPHAPFIYSEEPSLRQVNPMHRHIQMQQVPRSNNISPPLISQSNEVIQN